LNDDDNDDFYGDYQLMHLDNKGNGFFKTPLFSVRQLFYYDDENCTAIATELKLIVDGVNKFKDKKFQENYDLNFIHDSVFNEWGLREFPRFTIFKNIKRISPHDEVIFKNGEIIVKMNNYIKIPNSFKYKFKNDKKSLYDEYFNNLEKFVEETLNYLKPNLSKIRLGLTGGYDSRLALSILHNICDKLDITLECFTAGNDEHPDIVIAKEIAKTLNIKHEHIQPPNNKSHYPQNISEYLGTFYKSQGDYNSNDWQPIVRKDTELDIFFQHGMDAYKRYNMNLLYSGNRWFAKRVLRNYSFFYPLFYTEHEVFFAFSYCNNENVCNDWKDFVYEVLKRSEPKLLEIPIVGDIIPNTNIKPYSTGTASNFHPKEPFLWDPQIIKKGLSNILRENIEKKIGIKGKLLLKIIGLNELDFFLNQNIFPIILEYRQKKSKIPKVVKDLLKVKKKSPYPHVKTFIEIFENDPYSIEKRRMPILMDFASAGNMHSFEQIEKYLFNE